MFAFDDIPIRFLIDHTFFHDYFRTDYPHNDVVDWLFHYTYYRNTFIPNEKIIIVPKIIFDKVQFEFPIYHGIVHSVIQSLCKIIDLFPIEVTDHDLSMINVAVRLLSKDIIPIIVSSVNKEKWLDHIQRWGIKIGLEGFTDVMSDRRIHDKLPCVLIDTKKAEAKEILSIILSTYDSEYQEVIQYITLIKFLTLINHFSIVKSMFAGLFITLKCDQ